MAEADPAQTPQTPYDRLGGEPVIAAIVNRFYDVMEADPAFAELRAMHAPNLGPMRQSLTGFLVGWSGGPRHWFEANPGKCMMSAHAAVGITPKTADQWVAAMRQAIAETPSADPVMGEALAQAFERMAAGMARG
jgi:hemoglobin